MSAAPTGASAACSSASPSCSRPPSPAASSPSSSAARRASRARRGRPARPAPRRAGARRGGSRPLAAARPPGRGDRRLAADAQLPARRPPALAGRDRDHARRRADYVRAIAVSPDGKTLAVGGLGTARAALLRRETYEQIGEPVPVPVAPGATPTSRDSRTAPTARRSLSATRIGVPPSHRRARRASCSPRRASGRRPHRLHGRRVAAVAVELEDDADHARIRDAATLEPIGDPIVPEGFVGRVRRLVPASPCFALTPDGRSIVTASDDGELAWWDLRSREKTRTLQIETGPSRARAEPGRAHGGGRHRRRHPARRPAQRRGADRRHRRARDGPHWLALQPGRRDGRVDEPRRGRDALGRRFGDATRDAAGPLGRRPAARLQPRRETLYTASHDGTAIAWDLTGDRRPRPPVHVHARPRVRRSLDRHPGEFSPDGRLIAVGLKERGHRSSGTRTSSRRPARRSWTPAARSRSSRSRPDGRTLAAVDDAERPGDRSGTSHHDRSATGRSPSSGPVERRRASARTGRRSRPPAPSASSSGTSPPERALGTPRRRARRRRRRLQPDRAAPRVRATRRDRQVMPRSGTSPAIAARHASGEPDFRQRVLGYAVAFSPDGRTLATAGLRPARTRLGRCHGEADAQARSGWRRRADARVQPRQQVPRRRRASSPWHRSGTSPAGRRSARD